MNSRERIQAIIHNETFDQAGFWIGRPHETTLDMLTKYYGVNGLEGLQQKFHDDIRWFTPSHLRATYAHPDGKPMRPWKEANPHGLSNRGLLNIDSSITDIDTIDFPELCYLDFEEITKQIDQLDSPSYVISGFWAPFFHDLTYLFGTEDLLVLMMIKPELVQLAAERICKFYLEANELFFKQSADRINGVFIGNDFGTQQGLLISPEMFRAFFLPWIERFADQAHSYGLDFILHSCGSVRDIIDDLIAVNVDCLHPLQTTARGMDPFELGKVYREHITFMGGIDTQGLLQSGSVDEVRQAVRDLLEAFDTRCIIGPSHEAMLPTVSCELVDAMGTSSRTRPMA